MAIWPAFVQNVTSNVLSACAQNGNGQAAGAGRLQRSVLVARAAWLVGVCGGELPPALWSSALSSLTSHIADADVVLGLTATSAAMSLCTALLEQQHVRTPSSLCCLNLRFTQLSCQYMALQGFVMSEYMLDSCVLCFDQGGAPLTFMGMISWGCITCGFLTAKQCEDMRDIKGQKKSACLPEL